MARFLVLGGTRFLSRWVAAAALTHGHEVVCAARGASGTVPDGAELVAVDRDQGLGPLVGQHFDAVVDVAWMSVPWVRDALAAVRADHWTFVSSISVYADTAEHGLGTDAELLPPVDSPRGVEDYGGVKVASELAVREVHPDALIVRAGLICGPDDRSDRFGYWPARFARGGRAVVPDAAAQPAEIVDVRDLAEWIVRCAADPVGGTFDASGPETTLGAVLDEIADAVGDPELERVPVAPAALEASGVAPWSGPRSLPLWLPASHLGIAARDTAPAAAAGLTCRPVAETARAALDNERALGLDRERSAGLSAAEEREVLDQVDASSIGT